MKAPQEHQEIILKHAKHIASLATYDDLYNGHEFNEDTCRAVVYTTDEIVDCDGTMYTFSIEATYTFSVKEEGDGWNEPYQKHIENIELCDLNIEELYDETNEIDYECITL